MQGGIKICRTVTEPFSVVFSYTWDKQKRRRLFYVGSSMETWGVILRSRSDVYTGNLQQDHCQSDTQATGAEAEGWESLHPLMKLVRAKFEHACMVSDKVQNIRAFVDKYMYEYKVLWIKLHSWRQMEKAAAWGCLVFERQGQRQHTPRMHLWKMWGSMRQPVLRERCFCLRSGWSQMKATSWKRQKLYDRVPGKYICT